MKRILCLLLILVQPVQAGTLTVSASTTQTTTTTTTTTLAGGNSDAFTGADGTALTTHDSNWVTLPIDASHDVANCRIQGNKAENVSTSGCSGMYNTSSSDISQITFSADAYSDGYKGVCVRAGATGGYCARFTSPSGGNWTQVEVDKNGSYLGSFSSLSYAQASTHVVKIQASGTSPVTLEVWVDGGSLGTKSDASSPIASGKPGFYTVDGGSGANTDMDDWQDY